MMRSLFAGVSGLRNHQTRMDVIGNNIANVNTTGFKAGRVNFQDMLSQTLKGASSAQGNQGGTNPSQIGLGMSVASIDTLFTDGSTQTTGVPSDLAISGDGFFVVADGAKQYYTRAGNFTFDAAGNYETAAGLKVMGWMADASGNINASGSLQPVVKPSGQTMSAKQTASATFSGNLNSSQKSGAVTTTSVDIFDSLGATHKLTQNYYKVNQGGTGSTGNNIWYCKTDVANAASGTLQNQYTKLEFNTDGSLKKIVTVTPTATATTPAATTQAATLENLKLSTSTDAQTLGFTEFDSLGAMHTFQMNFSYTAGTSSALGTWNCDVKDAATQKTLQSYTVTWNNATSTYDFTPAPATTPISYTNENGATETVTLAVAAGAVPPDSLSIAGNFLDPANATVTSSEAAMTFSVPGANDMTVTLDRSKVTQASDSTSSLTPDQDGYAMGTLSGYSFDSSGVMTGTFSNGQKKKLAQVALANFTNPAGLNKVSDTLYEKSNNSGEPSVGSTNTGGRGKISPSSLEMSNVDLAQQFSDMIITQRGYQANSKIITTTDTMLEELVNLKR